MCMVGMVGLVGMVGMVDMELGKCLDDSYGLICVNVLVFLHGDFFLCDI